MQYTLFTLCWIVSQEVDLFAEMREFQALNRNFFSFFQFKFFIQYFVSSYTHVSLFALLSSYRRKETSWSSHCRGTTVCCCWVSDTFFFISWIKYLKHRSFSYPLMSIGNFGLTIVNLTKNFKEILWIPFYFSIFCSILYPLGLHWLNKKRGWLIFLM